METETRPVSKIKIGRKEYDVYPGDYILDNGHVYQFCTHKKERVLKTENYSHYTALRISETALKRLNIPDDAWIDSKRMPGCRFFVFKASEL